MLIHTLFLIVHSLIMRVFKRNEIFSAQYGVGTRDDMHWSFKSSVDLGLENLRTFAQIHIPADCELKNLEDVATRDNVKIRAPVHWRPRGPDHCQTCDEARVSVQTVACEGVFTGLAAAVETHVRRKLLLANSYECGMCCDTKLFRDFVVTE
jgi:hypothetical protein